MSVFKLYFRTDNAAFDPFEDDTVFAGEVVRILRAVAESIDAEGVVPTHYRTIFDINGNDVGRYALKEEH